MVNIAAAEFLPAEIAEFELLPLQERQIRFTFDCGINTDFVRDMSVSVRDRDAQDFRTTTFEAEGSIGP